MEHSAGMLRPGYNTLPTLDNGRNSKDVGHGNISISKKHLKLQKDLEGQLLVGEEKIQRSEPPAKEMRICNPLIEKDTRESIWLQHPAALQLS